jgi:pyruvate/2-oxoglutarate dehydrogenase complex dihydrolipoamide dehydrogenase (E3) component
MKQVPRAILITSTLHTTRYASSRICVAAPTKRLLSSSSNNLLQAGSRASLKHLNTLRSQKRFGSSTNQSTWSPPDISSRQVAVLGGGVLGRRIAASWVAAGYKVTLCDLNEEQRNAATHYIEHSREEFSAITGDKRKHAQFTTTESMETAVKDAWLVVEALSEDQHDGTARSIRTPRLYPRIELLILQVTSNAG